MEINGCILSRRFGWILSTQKYVRIKKQKFVVICQFLLEQLYICHYKYVESVIYVYHSKGVNCFNATPRDDNGVAAKGARAPTSDCTSSGRWSLLTSVVPRGAGSLEEPIELAHLLVISLDLVWRPGDPTPSPSPRWLDLSRFPAAMEVLSLLVFSAKWDFSHGQQFADYGFRFSVASKQIGFLVYSLTNIVKKEYSMFFFI